MGRNHKVACFHRKSLHNIAPNTNPLTQQIPNIGVLQNQTMYSPGPPFNSYQVRISFCFQRMVDIFEAGSNHLTKPTTESIDDFVAAKKYSIV